MLCCYNPLGSGTQVDQLNAGEASRQSMLCPRPTMCRRPTSQAEPSGVPHKATIAPGERARIANIGGIMAVVPAWGCPNPRTTPFSWAD